MKKRKEEIEAEQRAVRLRDELCLQQIKTVLTMEDILEKYYHTSEPGRPINEKKVCCPFHEEKTPSFSWREDYYKCFGCDEGGDQISFVRKYFNLDYREALHKLDADFVLGTYEQELSPMVQKRVKEAQEHRTKERLQRQEEDAVYTRLCDEIRELEKTQETLLPKLTNQNPDEFFDNPNLIAYAEASARYEQKLYERTQIELKRYQNQKETEKQKEGNGVGLINKVAEPNQQDIEPAALDIKIGSENRINSNPKPDKNGTIVAGWSKVTINDALEIPTVSILERQDGSRYIRFPQYVDKEGNFKPYIIPTNKPIHAAISETVLHSFDPGRETSFVQGTAPEKLDAHINNVSLYESGKTKALGSIVCCGLQINGIHVIESENNEFVTLPTAGKYVNSKGVTVYPEVVRIVDQALKKEIKDMFYNEFSAKKEVGHKDKDAEPPGLMKPVSLDKSGTVGEMCIKYQNEFSPQDLEI